MVRLVSADRLTVVVNTGDDTVLHGLYICPDLDTVCYTLSGRNDEERGWGLAGETWQAMESMASLGGDAWFRLGDRDLGTHLFRTQRLAEGASLTEVTAGLVQAMGVPARVLPMSDDPVRTMVRLAEDDVEVAFQEYFVRLRHQVPVSAVRFDGAARARPAPGVLRALDEAEAIVICPSNPVVSIGPLLAVPGIEEALSRRRSQAVAVSPIVAGAAIKGPADRMLTELGEEATVVGVARRYRHLAATLVVDVADAHLAGRVEELGMRCVVTDTVMRSVEDAAALSTVALEAVRDGT